MGDPLLTLEDVIAFLNAARIRATYGAVADVTGGIARGVGARLTAIYSRSPEASWVVSSDSGTPTGYEVSEQHPALLSNSEVIISGAELLQRVRTWKDGKQGLIEAGLANDAAHSTQRDVMRRVFHECRGDEERVIASYAAAERRGDVRRTSNEHNYSPEQYARALLMDGLAKGWLPHFDTQASLRKASNSSPRLAAKQPSVSSPAQPSVSTAPQLSVDDLAALRRKLVLLAKLDQQPTSTEGIRKRIGRLSQTGGPVPRHIAALMVTITEMRNSAEYESKVLSPSECTAVTSAWQAIQDWAKTTHRT